MPSISTGTGMATKRTGTPWMPADDYGRALQGLGVNLLVRDIAASVEFSRTVLGAEADRKSVV